MQDGIYHLRVFSNFNDYGEGIAVVRDNFINGGNGGFIFTGTKQEQDDDQFSCTLDIKQWNHEVISVLGPMTHFTLCLTGTNTADNGFIATGYMAGQDDAEVAVQAKYLSPIA